MKTKQKEELKLMNVENALQWLLNKYMKRKEDYQECPSECQVFKDTH